MPLSQRAMVEKRSNFAGVERAFLARLSAPGPIPPKRMRIRHAEPHAEKRLALRHGRHFSVVFWRPRQTVEFLEGRMSWTRDSGRHSYSNLPGEKLGRQDTVRTFSGQRAGTASERPCHAVPATDSLSLRGNVSVRRSNSSAGVPGTATGEKYSARITRELNWPWHGEKLRELQEKSPPTWKSKGLNENSSRDDRTAVELFIAGVRLWEVEMRRRLPWEFSASPL